MVWCVGIENIFLNAFVIVAEPVRAALCDEISYQYTYTHNAMQRIAVTSYIFSGNEFGVFLGYGPSSICYDGIVPPVTNAFSFCIFVNLHQAAPTSNVFRFEPPTGALFSIGNSHIYMCVYVHNSKVTWMYKMVSY